MNKGVAEVKSYLEYIQQEASIRYGAGMSALDAAKDIPLGRFSSWTESERMVVNVEAVYRELRGDEQPPNILTLFGEMAVLALQH